MKLIYWLAPTLGLAAFAGYYHHWENQLGCIKDANVKAYSDPYAEYEHRDGCKEAEADWLRGKPQLLTLGLPVHWINEHGEILKREYGVDQKAVAGCIVTDALVKFTDDYNEVIERHLKARHGEGVMAKVARQAEALYAERHPVVEKTKPERS